MPYITLRNAIKKGLDAVKIINNALKIGLFLIILFYINYNLNLKKVSQTELIDLD